MQVTATVVMKDAITSSSIALMYCGKDGYVNSRKENPVSCQNAS